MRKKCLLVFPISNLEICEMLSNYISEKFEIICIEKTYDQLTKRIVHDINMELKDTFVLILGLWKGMTSENCYKLGLAHAHQIRVVLIDLEAIYRLPIYIKYDVIIQIRSENGINFPEFMHKFHNVMKIVLNEDIYDLLYQKAINICEVIEKVINCRIERRNKKDFIKSLKNEDISAFINNDDKLYYMLTAKIFKYKDELHNALYKYNKIKQQGRKKLESKKEKIKSAWANGSFFLFATIAVIITLGILAKYVPFYTLAVILIAGLLFIPLIGALQLKNDDRLKDKHFIELIKIVIAQLPLIGKFNKK